MFNYIAKYAVGGIIDTTSMRNDLKLDKDFFKDGNYTHSGKNRLAAIQQIEDNQDKGLLYRVDKASNTFSITDQSGKIQEATTGRGKSTEEGDFLYGVFSRDKAAKKAVSSVVYDAIQGKYFGDKLIPKKGTEAVTSAVTSAATVETTPVIVPAEAAPKQEVATPVDKKTEVKDNNTTAQSTTQATTSIVTPTTAAYIFRLQPKNDTQLNKVTEVNPSVNYDVSKSLFNNNSAEVIKYKLKNELSILNKKVIGIHNTWGSKEDKLLPVETKISVIKTKLSEMDEEDITRKGILKPSNSLNEVRRKKEYLDKNIKYLDYNKKKSILDNLKKEEKKLDKERNTKIDYLKHKLEGELSYTINDKGHLVYTDKDKKIVKGLEQLEFFRNNKNLEFKIKAQNNISDNTILNISNLTQYKDGGKLVSKFQYGNEFTYMDRPHISDPNYLAKILGTFKEKTIVEKPHISDPDYFNKSVKFVQDQKPGMLAYGIDNKDNKDNNLVASPVETMSAKGDQRHWWQRKPLTEEAISDEDKAKALAKKENRFHLLSKTGVNTPLGNIGYGPILKYMMALNNYKNPVDVVATPLEDYVSRGSRNVLAARDLDSSTINNYENSIASTSSGYNGSDPVMAMMADKMLGESKRDARNKIIGLRSDYRRGEEGRVAQELEEKRLQESNNLVERTAVDNRNKMTAYNTDVARARAKAENKSELYKNTDTFISTVFSDLDNQNAIKGDMRAAQLAQKNARDYAILQNKTDQAYLNAKNHSFYGNKESFLRDHVNKNFSTIDEATYVSDAVKSGKTAEQGKADYAKKVTDAGYAAYDLETARLKEEYKAAEAKQTKFGADTDADLIPSATRIQRGERLFSKKPKK